MQVQWMRMPNQRIHGRYYNDNSNVYKVLSMNFIFGDVVGGEKIATSKIAQAFILKVQPIKALCSLSCSWSLRQNFFCWIAKE